MATNTTIRWLSVRIRLIGFVVFFVGSLLPPYIPKAALAPEETSVALPQFLLVEDGFIMKSASLSRAGSRRAYAEGIIHTVKEGESIDRLAGRYGIAHSTIRWANDLDEDEGLQPGDEILILPVDGVLHTVGRGQSLIQISQLYDVPIEVISEQNAIQGGFLLAGQELIIPEGKPIIGTPVVVASADPPPAAETPPAEQPSSPPSKPVEPPAATRPEPPTPNTPPAYTSNPTAGVLQKPCSAACFITQYYRAGHYALDMQERGGGPIYASEAGTVTRADYGWNGGFGNVIEVDHGNGLVTLYAHNKELLVGLGDVVSRGQQIAWMGNTGLVYGATGIHVHYEVRLRGVKKNPLLYIQ